MRDIDHFPYGNEPLIIFAFAIVALRILKQKRFF